jgi:hypothetical protein
MVQGVGGALLMTNGVVIVTDAFRKGGVGFALGVKESLFLLASCCTLRLSAVCSPRFRRGSCFS